MTTLVTGATGFVGAAVVRHLLAAGRPVRVLTRRNNDRRNIEGLAVEIAEGDLTDRSSLEAALSGCAALYHVAADYRIWVPDPDAIYRVNVEGTRQLMLAALEAGVSRIVYTSSVATLGLHKDGTPADEATPVGLEDMVGHYKRSKYLAEAEVQRLVREKALPAVIVTPSTPVGPRDVKPTPTGRMIADGTLDRLLAERYRGWSEGLGASIAAGKEDFTSLEAYALDLEGVELESGRQEYLESLVNRYL